LIATTKFDNVRPSGILYRYQTSHIQINAVFNATPIKKPRRGLNGKGIYVNNKPK